MNEIWKPIPGVDRYEVSDQGRVRNLGGQMHKMFRGRLRKAKAANLKPCGNPETGYCSVRLPGQISTYVHRLVALVFCEGFSPGLVVDHINGIRGDNRAVNLQWVTNSKNVSRAYKEQGKEAKRGKDAFGAKPIVAVNLTTGEVLRFPAAQVAQRERGFIASAISACCHGRIKSHFGWSFSFEEVGCGD